MKDAVELLAEAGRIGAANRKDWVRLADLRAAFEALVDHAPPAPAPELLHGLDAQGWYDTARRYHAGLQTIAHTHGKSIDHDWCRRQADYYLGHVQDGSMVWQMPGAPDLHHIVVPDASLAPPRRIHPAEPLAVMKPGDEVRVEIGPQS